MRRANDFIDWISEDRLEKLLVIIVNNTLLNNLILQSLLVWTLANYKLVIWFWQELCHILQIDGLPMKLFLTNDILTGTHYRKVKVNLAKELSLFAKKLCLLRTLIMLNSLKILWSSEKKSIFKYYWKVYFKFKLC